MLQRSEVEIVNGERAKGSRMAIVVLQGKGPVSRKGRRLGELKSERISSSVNLPWNRTGLPAFGRGGA